LKLGGGRRGLGFRTSRIKNSVSVGSVEIRSLPVRPVGSGSDAVMGLGENWVSEEQGLARDQALLARIDWTKHAKALATLLQNIQSTRMGNTIEVLQIMSSFYFPSARLGGTAFKCLNSGASFDA
jgi:hypothetical protein